MQCSLQTVFPCGWPGGTAVLLVVFQAVIFTKKGHGRRPEGGPYQRSGETAMKSSALTSLGPSVVILSGMLSLLVSVGGPMAWMRLSFIGSVMFESIAAGIGTASAGVQLGVDEMTTFAFTMAVWTMILGSIGWIIVSTLTADKMEKVQNRMAGGNSALVGVISGAAMVGAFGGMVSQKLVAVDKSALSCVLGGVFMAILLYVSGKFKISWLKEWNLTIAILVAMIITALV